MNSKKMTAVIARLRDEAENVREIGLGYARRRPGCLEAAVAKRCFEVLELAADQVAEAAELSVEVTRLPDGALFCCTTPRLDTNTVEKLREFLESQPEGRNRLEVLREKFGDVPQHAYCHGRDKGNTCPECSGAGWIVCVHGGLPGGDFTEEAEQIPCSKCDGTGRSDP